MRLRHRLAAGLPLPLILTLLQAIPAQPAFAAPHQPAADPPPKVSEAADIPSARVAAALSGAKV